jgi:phosphoadenosine phosphosulfate reductase
MIDLAPLDQHTKIALAFSGGKDSLALVYLLRPHLDRITIYHLDTGDLLPEIHDIVEHVRGFAPNFVDVRSAVAGWIETNGLPTDLLPFAAHDIGRFAGQEQIRTVPRYACCYANLMLPLWERIAADSITLLIRGTKAVDLKRLPAVSGTVHDGVEIWHPIEDWTHERVLAYLRSVNAPHNRIYDHMTNAPECARCSAWWGEGRAAYLAEYHPELLADYARRLRAVTGEILGSVNDLNRELGVINGNV